MRPCLVALFACLLAALGLPEASASEIAFIYVKTAEVVRLPTCPAGCEVRLYHFQSVGGTFAKHKSWWLEYFHAAGLFFPKGGFILYQQATGTLLLATTPEEQDLVVYLPPDHSHAQRLSINFVAQH